MDELLTGDIILVRGRRLRHKLARRMRGCVWNHVLLYYKHGYTMELEGRGLRQHAFFDRYARRNIVILRLKAEEEESVRERVERFTWVMNGLWQSRVKFDWLAFLFEMVRLRQPRRAGQMLCDDFVNCVYRAAGHEEIDVRDVMLHDYAEKQLNTRYGLTKVYDWRTQEPNVRVSVLPFTGGQGDLA